MGKGETALITGATSGIGYELTKIFGKAGFNLVLVARSKADLEKVAREFDDQDLVVKIFPCDLSKPNAAEAVYKEVVDDAMAVDVLVNNAGFGLYGDFAKSDLAKQEEMINLNILSLTKLTHLFLPGMIKEKRGKILNVASTAAFAPGPLMAVYYATKAYVLSFSQALSMELRGTGVSVTALCPGPTATNFLERARAQRSFLFSKFFMMDAATVAAASYKGMMRGQRVVIPGFLNKVMVFGGRHIPTTITLRLVKLLQKRTR